MTNKLDILIWLKMANRNEIKIAYLRFASKMYNISTILVVFSTRPYIWGSIVTRRIITFEFGVVLNYLPDELSWSVYIFEAKQRFAILVSFRFAIFSEI